MGATDTRAATNPGTRPLEPPSNGLVGQFSPQLVHKRLVDRVHRDLTDIITIARLLTPRAFGERVGPIVLDLIEKVDDVVLFRVLSDTQVISWIDAAGQLVRKYESTLQTSVEWATHLSRLPTIACAAAILTKERCELQVDLEEEGGSRLPVSGLVVFSKSEARSVKLDTAQLEAGASTEEGIGIAQPITIANHEILLGGRGSAFRTSKATSSCGIESLMRVRGLRRFVPQKTY
jgi:hypothetical protein